MDFPDRYVCLTPLNDGYQLVLLVKEPPVADKNRDDDTEGYKNNRTQEEFQFSRVFSIFKKYHKKCSMAISQAPCAFIIV